MSEKKKTIQPDYDYWIKMPYWTLFEAVYLIHGEKPRNDCIPSVRKDLQKTHELIKRSLFYDSYNSPSSDLEVIPYILIEWAKNKGISIPNELKPLGEPLINPNIDTSTDREPEAVINHPNLWMDEQNCQANDSITKTNVPCRDLTFCAESNEEISIKEPRKPKRDFRYYHIGFERSDTKEWRDLIQILKNHPYRYYLGKSKDKKYERRRRRLNVINKKLISHIEKQFPNVKIPDNGKLYELCKGDEPGTYKFRFKVVPVYSESEDFDQLRKRYEKLPKEKLLSLCIEMMKSYLGKPIEYLKKKIDVAKTVLMEMHGFTEKTIYEEYQKRTDTDTDKDVITNEFSESDYAMDEKTDEDDQYSEIDRLDGFEFPDD